MAYALAHKGKTTAPEVTYNPADGPEAYTIASVHSKLSEYTSAACERHGGDFDPATQPLDTDLLMRLGGGKQHDRYWMADSIVDSTSVPMLARFEQGARASPSPYALSSRAHSSRWRNSKLVLFYSSFIAFTHLPCLCIV